MDFWGNQMAIGTSVNYQFACIYLRVASFSLAVFDRNYKNDENTTSWIVSVLNIIESINHLPIAYEYYNMDFKFAENDDGSAKAIIIKVPNPRYECECNYVGIVKKNNKIRYFTSELYIITHEFCLCEFMADGSHCAYGTTIDSFEDFTRTILDF